MERSLFPWALGALLGLAFAPPASGDVWAPMTGQGPAGIEKTGDATGIVPMAGAVRAMVVHPTDPDIVWIGSVNGGVWYTTNGTSAAPDWTPLSDHAGSLSIGGMEMDPTFSSHEVLVAVIGRSSAFSDPGRQKVGGNLGGLLRTTNAVTWVWMPNVSLAEQNLDAVAPRGDVILVASKGGAGPDPGGIFRSTDTGQTFTRLSGQPSTGLPAGAAYDMVGDSADVTTLYAAIGGNNGDIYRNGATGAGAWTALGLSDPALAAGLDSASNMKLAVGYDTSTAKSTLYAAIQESMGQGVRLFRYANGTWSELDSPQSVECGLTVGLKRSGQVEHLSLAVHPNNPDLVFIGGDGQPLVAGPDGNCGTSDDPPSGRLMRCDASKPAGSQWTPLIGANTASYTGPHPDSRVLRFDANNELLDGNDGGVYRRTSPKGSSGDWSSLNGNLSLTETHTCAYDRLLGIAICGTQDNGTAQQRSPGSTVWDNVGCCDGGQVAVAYDDAPAPTQSVRYRSKQNLGIFTRELCDSAGCTTSSPALTVSGSGGQSLGQFDTGLPFTTPIAANAVDWQRLAIGSSAVYESTDQGATVDVVPVAGGASLGTVRALASGGYAGSTPHKNVLYAGTTQGVFRRKPSESALSQTGYAGTAVDLTLDPADWKSVWVASADAVWRSADAGDTWEDISGNLAEEGASTLRSIAFIPGQKASIIVVGAADGTYVTNSAHLGRWYKFGGALPNAVAYDLSYDAQADKLLVATVGRGLWTVDQAGAMNLPPYLTPVADVTGQEGSPITVQGAFDDPDRTAGEIYSVGITYGDGDLDFPDVSGDGSFTDDHAYVDEGTYAVTVIAADSSGGTDTRTATATIANVAPSVGAPAVSPNPAPLGTAVSASAAFTDPGILDDHTATIAWGDGTGAAPATVTESGTSGTAAGSHDYTAAGVYPVTVTVTDEDGDSGSASYQYAVVYDPAGSYVTGSGWFDSSAGAYPAEPSLTGKAHFGFVSRYKNGQSMPDGSTLFKFHAGGFDFKSTGYEWLVAAGARAQFTGSGTVNGSGEYGFLLTAVDGAVSGGGGVDRIRFKVWDRLSGAVVYDSQPGAPDTANPIAAPGAGEIVVHP